MKIITAAGIATATVLAIAGFFASFQRIETGEVGLRIGMDKQVAQQELLPGTFNQTLFGDVLIFPVKDVAAVVENITPIAADNSSMADVDATIIYSLDQSAVAELYSTRSKSFHSKTEAGETLLMYNYVLQAGRNALYKVMRSYEALQMNDKRVEIEVKVKEELLRLLAEEKLNGQIIISQVQVRNIRPAESVSASANELVRAKNDLQKKAVEVRIAEEEARRMAALTNQSQASIEYMRAQALLNISEGVKAGKVSTVVVPVDFKGIVQVK